MLRAHVRTVERQTNTFCDVSEEIWSWIAAVGREDGGKGADIRYTAKLRLLIVWYTQGLASTPSKFPLLGNAHQDHWYECKETASAEKQGRCCVVPVIEVSLPLSSLPLLSFCLPSLLPHLAQPMRLPPPVSDPQLYRRL